MYVRVLDYQLRSVKIMKQHDLMLISDVHIEPNLSRRDEVNFIAISGAAKQRKPDAIIIAGDFIDTLEVLYHKETLKRIESFLRSLSKIAPVYIGVGNHDLGFHYEERQAELEPKLFLEYQKFISTTPANLLHDSSIQLDTVKGIRIAGLTLPLEYYDLSKIDRNNKQGKRDYLEKLLTRADALLTDETNSPNSDTDFIITLVHSPECLDNEIRNMHPKIDLFISGHLHNGLVPAGMFGLTRFSNSGLVSSDYSLFPDRARGTSRDLNDGLLVLGAVKTIPTDSSKVLKIVTRPLYPPEISFLHLLPE